MRTRSNSYAAARRMAMDPCVVMTGMGLAHRASVIPVKPEWPGALPFARPLYTFQRPRMTRAAHGTRSKKSRRAQMMGLGIAVTPAGSVDTLTPFTEPLRTVPFGVIANRGFGPQPPIIIAQPPGSIAVGPAPVTSPVVGSPAPSPVATSGTPVPANYPTDQIFVDPNGNFWEYSAAQNAWLNVGNPYNVGASATSATEQAASAALPASSGASTATPATVGSSTIVASDGSIWQYNSATGAWVETSGPGSATPAVGAPPPSALVSGATSDYQSAINWLQSDSLLETIGVANIPNWIAVVVGGVALKLIFDRVNQQGGRK